MFDIENALIGLLSEFKGLKTVSIFFLCAFKPCANKSTELYSEEFKDEMTKLIESDKITVYGGLYTKFDDLSKELVDSHLKDDKYFPSVAIGLPDEK